MELTGNLWNAMDVELVKLQDLKHIRLQVMLIMTSVTADIIWSEMIILRM